jgi:hypothetical protein
MSHHNVGNRREIMKETTDLEKGEDELAATTRVSKETFRKLFRVVFSGENCMVELYPREILVAIDDIRLLYKQINEKLSRQDTSPISFSAIAGYENGKSQEYGSWERFNAEDWSSPDVLHSLSLTWRFMLSLPRAEKPSLHSVNVRVSAAVSPQHVIQALFSKDPEEAEQMQLSMVTMSARIDFVDHILSQELLELISKWNKSLRSPEHVFPFMKWVKLKTDPICKIVRRSLPILATMTCFSFFIHYSQQLDRTAPVTTEILTNIILWLMASIILIYLSLMFGRSLSSYINKQLKRFGRFTSIELTRGDKNLQDKLLARTRNSFWKFAVSSFVTFALDVAAAILIATLLHK